jgi:hypothetical protein
MRMTCSIVESAVARSNILIRWASALSSAGSGIGRGRISRLQSRAWLRSQVCFLPRDMDCQELEGSPGQVFPVAWQALTAAGLSRASRHHHP